MSAHAGNNIWEKTGAGDAIAAMANGDPANKKDAKDNDGTRGVDFLGLKWEVLK